jgi:hypothetical protein
MTHHTSTFGSLRRLTLAAAAMFALSIAAGQRADAMSLMAPGTSPAKAASADVLQVRGGHGGGGHGGGGHGGFHGGGFHGGGFHGGGFHGGGWHGGGFRHYGGFHHHGGFAHFHHRRFYGGYAPYYSSYYPHCRIIYTYYGPRRVCGYHHRWHHRRWHHRRYW